MPEDIRARLGSRPFQSPQSPLPRPTPTHGFASPQSAIRRAADLCSVFVGNLPANADEQSLKDTFGVQGHIHKIELVRKPAVNGQFSDILYTAKRLTLQRKLCELFRVY